MNDHYNAKLQPYAKKLRRDMTKEERHLWYDFLKQIPLTVHRQKILGKYIADFYIASAKIVIELDGSQHFEDVHMQQDALRDDYFRQIGCMVLRYSNADVNLRFSSVCEVILNHISSQQSLD